MDPEFAVEIANLSKTYLNGVAQAPNEALQNVQLKIRAGSFFGLLGPNGAGKSTIINIMAGLVIKTSGEVKIWGYDIEQKMRQARSAIGVVPQELNIDPFFSPREILEVQAGLYGVPKGKRKTAEILEAVSLSDKADTYSRTLSGGMRRRLLVAKAMVHSPPVLVLDEPTAGVDVELRQQLWAYLRWLRDRGTTILLTTHYLEEAQELCDTIAIINKGNVIACQPKEDILRILDTKELVVLINKDISEVPTYLSKFSPELRGRRNLVFNLPSKEFHLEEIIGAFGQGDLTIVDLTTKETDLEDIFLMLTKEGMDPLPNG